MATRLCETCVYRDTDWFDRHGETVHTEFCAANKPQFPAALKCPLYKQSELVDAD